MNFRTQPAPGDSGALSVQPVIEVRGTDGSLMTGINNAPVTIFVKPGTGVSGSYLTGKNTVGCVNGVASFTDLGISQRGQGYVLRAVFLGLPPVDSQPFDVTGAAFSWWDVAHALRVASGLEQANASDMINVNPETPTNGIDLLDTLRLARKVAGLEANP